MINLLPPTTKAGFNYARRSKALRKWIVFFTVALIGLGAIATVGLLSLKQSTLSNQRQAAALTADLERERVTQTKKQVSDISSSIKLTYKVLSTEILFSKLIVQIGAAIPKGAILSGLNINQTTGGIDLTATATDYTTATQVQVNLADPSNKIFSKADIVSINCNPSGENVATAYPCTVTIRALFGNNSPFLFVNQGKQP